MVEIRKSRLARVICDNTDIIDTVQLYPMVLPDHELYVLFATLSKKKKQNYIYYDFNFLNLLPEIHEYRVEVVLYHRWISVSGLIQCLS